MPTLARFSLWLVPEGAVVDDLQAIIDRLAQEHGGPPFPPHVTLLGGIVVAQESVLERVHRLATQTAPLTIHLDDVDVGETYFQSLFATVRPAPDLLALHEAAQHAFPESPAEPYRPHLSLLYGHPSPETKQAILTALRGTLPPAFQAGTLVVNRSADTVADWRTALRASLPG